MRKDPTDDPFYRPGTLYSRPSNRLVLDSIPGALSSNSIFSVLQRVPGVQVFERGIESTVVIRNQIVKTFLLDNIATDIEVIQSLNPADIVLKGVEASSIGMMRSGGGGVISVYTRNGYAQPVETDRPGIVQLKHPRYYKVREFSSPDYSSWKAGHEKPDFRTTVYWNPEVSCKTDSSVQVSFFCTDSSADYFIEVEGITAKGIPIRAMHLITVE